MEMTEEEAAGSLGVNLKSVAPQLGPGAGESLGRVIAGFPEFAPERIGPRDPPRTRVNDLPLQLEEAVSRSGGLPDIDYLLERRSTPEGYGSMRLLREAFDLDGTGFSSDFAQGFLPASWFESQERLDRLVEYFVGLVEVIDAFYGVIDSQRMLSKHDWFMMRRAKQDLASPALVSRGRNLNVFEHYIRGVSWVQFFGPAYVARFGEAALRGLGVRSQLTSNGGVVVWATETPFVYDPKARRSTDYPRTKPFIELFGDGIWHEGFTPGGPGEHIPDFREHGRFVTK